MKDDNFIRLRDYRPNEMEASAYLQDCADRVRAAGCSAEQVANLLLHAVWNLHSMAQGAGQQAEGWVERATLSFQRALAGFCVETLNSETTPDFRYVPLPYFDARFSRRRFNRKWRIRPGDNHQYGNSEPVSGEFLAATIKKRAACICQHKLSLPECLLTLRISRRPINI
jgi:hypothetical protein